MKQILLSFALLESAAAFVTPSPAPIWSFGALFTAAQEKESVSTAIVEDERSEKRRTIKKVLLSRLGGSSENIYIDPILADPETKEPLSVSFKGPILGGTSTSAVGVFLRSASTDSGTRVYEGRTDTYFNLLEPVFDKNFDGEKHTSVSGFPNLPSLLLLTPPPLRSFVANINSNIEYVPMRDLFTLPQVSFAYERGWRQGFQVAGFPGADAEFELAKQYFEPAISSSRSKGEDDVLVDMSCATGLFTRRFVISNEYTRVIACDYSDSMLREARRRIRGSPEVSSSSTKLDLVRCDVAKIPIKTESINAFHAGAAMHCWPEIAQSLQEVYRVLVPGGRYFATTFLGNYFNRVASAERASNGGENVAANMQAYQYFPTTNYLRDLMLDAGFEDDKVNVELVGTGCVIIRCEK